VFTHDALAEIEQALTVAPVGAAPAGAGPLAAAPLGA